MRPLALPRLNPRRLRSPWSFGEGRCVGSMVRNVLPMNALAEHASVVAVLRVDFARLATRRDGSKLVPIGDGAGPVCGLLLAAGANREFDHLQIAARQWSPVVQKASYNSTSCAKPAFNPWP